MDINTLKGLLQKELHQTFFLFSIIVGFASQAFCQTKLSLVPSLGLQVPRCYLIDDAMADPGFGVNNFYLDLSADISFQLDIKNDWLFFAGYQAGSSGYSYNYGTYKVDNTTARVSVGLFVNRFPFGVKKHIQTIKWIKIDKRLKSRENINRSNENILYLCLFRLQGLMGLSIDKVAVSSYENEWINYMGAYERYTISNHNTASIFGGVTLQFFNYHRDHLQLTFLYSQGLRNTVSTEIEYILSGKDYSAKVGSRCSYFSVSLGYPIRLAKK